MKYYIVECVDSKGIKVYDINTEQNGKGFSLNIWKNIYDYDEAKFVCSIANEAIELYEFAKRQSL